MISFNCYQEGYNDGFRDAMNGRSKRYTVFTKWKAFVSGHAYDTYVDGYNQAYAAGMSKKREVYK